MPVAEFSSLNRIRRSTPLDATSFVMHFILARKTTADVDERYSRAIGFDDLYKKEAAEAGF